MNGHNFGKTIGISYDSADYETVQMIEHELNKGGHRVWTTYDHMDDHFIPSFISIMSGTQYLIVCLSDTYRLNNRCRNELLYATACGFQVLSWKVHVRTNNQDQDEQIRIRAVETLLNRITPNNNEKLRTKSTSLTDIAFVNINIPKRRPPTNGNRRRRTKEIMSLENWPNPDVLAWCRSINLPGFFKLIKNFDGRSVIKLYEFCKQNSTETISLLNNDLHHACKEENTPDIQISIHEFIRFQIEVEKLLLAENFSVSISPPKLDTAKKRSKIKTCSIL